MNNVLCQDYVTTHYVSTAYVQPVQLRPKKITAEVIQQVQQRPQMAFRFYACGPINRVWLQNSAAGRNVFCGCLESIDVTPASS